MSGILMVWSAFPLGSTDMVLERRSLAEGVMPGERLSSGDPKYLQCDFGNSPPTGSDAPSSFNFHLSG